MVMQHFFKRSIIEVGSINFVHKHIHEKHAAVFHHLDIDIVHYLRYSTLLR